MLFKGICQKLAFVIWNKYSNEKNQQSVFSPAKTSENKRKFFVFSDQKILTPSDDSQKGSSLLIDRLFKKNNSKLITTNEVYVEDEKIQSIIEEDDRHHEELKWDLSYEQINGIVSRNYH